MVNPYHKINFIEDYLNSDRNDKLPEEYQHVVNVLSGQEEDISITAAYNIYKSPGQKNYVEALLFSNITPEKISELFNINVAIIQSYANYFFDVNIFKNKIDKMEYLNNAKANLAKKLIEVKEKKKSVSPEEIADIENVLNGIKIMLMYIKLGSDYIEYIIGGKEVSEDVVAGLIYSSVKDAIVTATANKAIGNNKEAKDWYRIAATLVSSLKMLSPNKDKDKEGDKDITDKIKIKLNEIGTQILDINTGDIVG